MSTDKRKEPRQRTLQAGRLVFNGASSTFDCLIRDRSESGARLSFGELLALPDAFDLILCSKGVRLPARLAWRKGVEAGIAFG